MKKEKFEIGNKIREIKVDNKQNSTILGVCLLIFNLFFIASAILLAYWINFWIIWVLDVLIVLFCVSRSIYTFIYSKKKHSYAIYENCLILNTVWYDNAIMDFNSINRIKMKVGFVDKWFRRGTHTLTIYLNDEIQTKINLYFIKEDPKTLIDEITNLSNHNFKPTKSSKRI